MALLRPSLWQECNPGALKPTSCSCAIKSRVQNCSAAFKGQSTISAAFQPRLGCWPLSFGSQSRYCHLQKAFSAPPPSSPPQTGKVCPSLEFPQFPVLPTPSPTALSILWTLFMTSISSPNCEELCSQHLAQSWAQVIFVEQIHSQKYTLVND